MLICPRCSRFCLLSLPTMTSPRRAHMPPYSLSLSCLEDPSPAAGALLAMGGPMRRGVPRPGSLVSGATSSQLLGCVALPAALPAPSPAPPGRAGITDTYFAQVPAGGQRLPCPRPCICPLPWAAAARFVGEGMWKHQSVRHFQGVTWRDWEGDRGRAGLVHGGDPALEPEVQSRGL